MDKKKILLSVLGILLLVLVTVGVTYAVFTYTKLGTTENTVTTGTLKFLYTENTGVGAGINIENAFPVSDTVGKSYDTDKYVFDFSVEATNTDNKGIPYEVTLRKKSTSTLPESNIKVYLTDMTDEADTQIVAPTLYSDLVPTTIDVGEEVEKTIYNGVVLGGELAYQKDFRLRMWISDDSNYDDIGGKTFTALVNVYANANLINDNTYKEALLNGADPVLESTATLAKGDGEVVRISNTENNNKLVPVIIGDDGSVTKADITKRWYSYADKEWANAVILKDPNGIPIYDSSGNKNHGTLRNGTYNADGKVSFDGVDDYINTDVMSPLSYGNTYSIVLKFKYKADSSVTRRIISAGGIGVSIGYDTGRLVVSTPTVNSSGSVVSQAARYALEDGKTYNLVITMDGEYIRIYDQSGVLNTSSKFENIELNTTSSILIGNTLGSGFNSEMYYIAFSDKAFTTDDINNYYTNGNVTNKDDLLFEYQFKETMNTIPESNIRSYFVWIPRYKYKIFDEGNYTGLTNIESKEQIIEIEFENKYVKSSNGTTKDSWLTHPAFTSFDSNGFWVGKFETGYNGAISPETAQVNSVDTSKIIIKPNVHSWRGINIGNAFKNGYDYMRDLDSHMMKNTEWGAVAYLQHSNYGSHKSVRVNNNSAYITGYSSVLEPSVGYNNKIDIEGNRVESTSIGVDGTYTVNYLNPKSIASSTTGNYTGVYDMSGGSWEFVMGYTTGASTEGGSSEITSLYSDFLNDTTYTKYWDRYTSTTNTNYNNRILGDATGEMGTFGDEADPDGVAKHKSSWYKDIAYFVNSSAPWFDRGGGWHDGTLTGCFGFNSATGGGATHVSFHIVLTPNN